nr:hypothetical protein [Rhodococcus wratislaviensis]GLK33617.1 hypothetical protein GCM10017611_04590 [Rhodococcus wratislaviensis]
MNAEQRRALEQVRDACAVLHSFMGTTDSTRRVPVMVWYGTYQQLTSELMDAVVGAQLAGVPEHVIFDSM